MGAEEEDGVLVRGGFHGAVSDVVDLKGNPKQQEVRDSADKSSSPRGERRESGVGSGTRGHGSEFPCRGFSTTTAQRGGSGTEILWGFVLLPGGSVAGPWGDGGEAEGSVLAGGRPDSPVFCAVLRGAGETRGEQGVLGRSSGLGGRTLSPKKASEIKAEGLCWQERQSRVSRRGAAKAVSAQTPELPESHTAPPARLFPSEGSV